MCDFLSLSELMNNKEMNKTKIWKGIKDDTGRDVREMNSEKVTKYFYSSNSDPVVLPGCSDLYFIVWIWTAGEFSLT